MNEFVLAELNRFLGTAQGREYMRQSLLRMENHREMIEKKIDSYNVPAELLAVPLIESGYRNLPPQANPYRAAGLWQFIASTARNFGLKVDARTDERLDVDLSTDAALRYIGANYLRFNDWQLAMMAYNMGEQNLQRAMDRVGSRDPWALIRAGHEGDRGYLANLQAAVLILKNPQAVE